MNKYYSKGGIPLIAIIIIAAVVLVGGGLVYYGLKNQWSSPTQQTVQQLQSQTHITNQQTDNIQQNNQHSKPVTHGISGPTTSNVHWVGVASNVTNLVDIQGNTGYSFTLTLGNNTTYKVNYILKAYVNAGPPPVKSGDTVDVYGTLSGNVITASWISIVN